MQAVRLPLADVPAAIRVQDANLRNQAILEFRAPDGQKLVKMGPRVISLHLLEPYPGWQAFSEQLKELVDSLFRTLPGLVVERIGLRYVNLLTAEKHGIRGVSDLDFSISVGGKPLLNRLNLNYQVEEADCTAVVRVASSEFVTTSKPGKFSALVDVDVFTPEGYSSRLGTEVLERIAAAHDIEKRQYKAVLGESVINRLRKA